MKTTRIFALTAGLPLALLLNQCGASQGSAAGSGAVDTKPTSIAQAKESLDRIEDLLTVNPNDATALQALKDMQPSLDELNHLVARVEPTSGHTVSFYETSPGVVNVAEVGPQSEPALVTSDDMGNGTIDALWTRLASGAAQPAALAAALSRSASAHDDAKVSNVSTGVGSSSLTQPPAAASAQPTTLGGEKIGTSSQALTNSQADQIWFRDHECFTGGDARGCLPSRTGGGYADYETKTSFIRVAPFNGNPSVQMTYEGTVAYIQPVFQGSIAGFWWHSDSFWACCAICACGTQDYNIRHHRWDITNASNVGFHWTFAEQWTCGDTLSCNAPPGP